MRTLAATMACVLGIAQPTAAAVYRLDYADASATIKVSATVTTSNAATTGSSGLAGFLITGIAGTRNGAAITGLLGSGAFGFPIDNRVYPNDPYTAFVNGDGIGFSVAGTTDVFNFFGGYRNGSGLPFSVPVYSEARLTDAGALVDVADIGRNATLSEVPEPASWALTILGAGLVGSAMRRRVGRTTASLA